MFKSSIFFMLFILLLLLLSSNAVILCRDKSTIYNRIAFSILILTFYIIYNYLNISYINIGKSLYEMYLHISFITNFLNLFILFLSIIILTLTGFYPKKVRIRDYSGLIIIIIGLIFNSSYVINLCSIFGIISFGTYMINSVFFISFIYIMLFSIILLTYLKYYFLLRKMSGYSPKKLNMCVNKYLLSPYILHSIVKSSLIVISIWFYGKYIYILFDPTYIKNIIDNLNSVNLNSINIKRIIEILNNIPIHQLPEPEPVDFVDSVNSADSIYTTDFLNNNIKTNFKPIKFNNLFNPKDYSILPSPSNYNYLLILSEKLTKSLPWLLPTIGYSTGQIFIPFIGRITDSISKSLPSVFKYLNSSWNKFNIILARHFNNNIIVFMENTWYTQNRSFMQNDLFNGTNFNNPYTNIEARTLYDLWLRLENVFRNTMTWSIINNPNFDFDINNLRRLDREQGHEHTLSIIHEVLRPHIQDFRSNTNIDVSQIINALRTANRFNNTDSVNSPYLNTENIHVNIDILIYNIEYINTIQNILPEFANEVGIDLGQLRSQSLRNLYQLRSLILSYKEFILNKCNNLERSNQKGKKK